jgi:hypothetical protein
MYPWEATRPKLRQPPSCRIEQIEVEQVMQAALAAMPDVGRAKPPLGVGQLRV